MNIYINNKLQELQGTFSLTDALDSINISTRKGIAVAVNNHVIPQGEWESHALKDNDKVTIITATQGG